MLFKYEALFETVVFDEAKERVYLASIIAGLLEEFDAQASLTIAKVMCNLSKLYGASLKDVATEVYEIDISFEPSAEHIIMADTVYDSTIDKTGCCVVMGTDDVLRLGVDFNQYKPIARMESNIRDEKKVLYFFPALPMGVIK